LRPHPDLALNLGLPDLRFKALYAGYGRFDYNVWIGEKKVEQLIKEKAPPFYGGVLKYDTYPETDLAINLGLSDLRFKQVHAGYGYFAYGVYPPPPAVWYGGVVKEDVYPETDLALNLGFSDLRFKQVHAGYGYFQQLYADSSSIERLRATRVESDLVPVSDLALNLGITDLRWLEVHGYYGYFGYGSFPHELRTSELKMQADGRIKPMSDVATRLFFVTRNIAEDTLLDHIFAPTDDRRGFLGDDTRFWREAYIMSGWIEDWYIRYWIDPWEDDIPSWGSRTLRHCYIYLGRSIDLQADLATATETLKNSAEACFHGEYWNGTKSVTRTAKIYQEMLSTIPTSRLVFDIALKKVLRLSDKGGIDGQFRIDDDTYAGQVTTDSLGNATITFTEHMGPVKPVVILIPELDPAVDRALVQITGWIQDAEGNYTGVTIKTSDDGGRNEPSVIVHYLVIRKSAM